MILIFGNYAYIHFSNSISVGQQWVCLSVCMLPQCIRRVNHNVGAPPQVKVLTSGGMGEWIDGTSQTLIAPARACVLRIANKFPHLTPGNNCCHQLTEFRNAPLAHEQIAFSPHAMKPLAIAIHPCPHCLKLLITKDNQVCRHII
jgi:hypothetical protein